MFDNEFIANEIACLNYEVPTDDVLDQIRETAEDYVAHDDFLVQEIMEKVDQAIFDARLPEQNYQ